MNDCCFEFDQQLKLNRMKYPVKIITLLFFFSMALLNTKAQQKHFIYIQSEDKQPFAVVLEGKVYSSSDYGYVIVPKLTDGTYNFTVSFPMNKFPEQSFKCVINKKDAGYTLKNIEDKGWGLLNIQTQKVLMGNSNDVAASNVFSDMLSEVVRDSNLVKKDIVFANTAADSINASSTAGTISDTITAGNFDSLDNNAGFVTDSIAQLKKISESKLDTGTNMVFVDKTQNGADTISVFVPATDSVNNNPVSNISTGQQQTDTIYTANNEMTKTDRAEVNHNETSEAMPDTSNHSVSNPFYKPNDNNTVLNTDANVVLKPDDHIVSKPQITNAVKEDCRSMISDNDMDKLKRKMFVQNNSNDMIQTAVKYLNNKCLTTDQVKALGNLFSSDDGRYTLYDALYNNVYDYGNYPLLESQVLDPYYKKRFEAMLR
jgi:hypothetical protein